MSCKHTDSAETAEARMYFRQMLDNDQWYDEHKGQYAIVGNDHIMVGPNMTRLGQEFRGEYGLPPALYALITREALVVNLRSPRVDRRRTGGNADLSDQ